jgi:hypothetical protein
MIIVVLTPMLQNNTQIIYEPLIKLGHQLFVINYGEDEVNHGLFNSIISYSPDVVIYLGALKQFWDKHVPSIDVLTHIGGVFPLVNICFDGAEPVWWPHHQRFHEAGCFALQVNIDGVRTGPIGEFGLTTLGPLDSSSFLARPWAQRPVSLGFGGQALNGVRAQLLEELLRRDILFHRPRDNSGSKGYIEFLTSCRCIWNHPMTGGTTRQHIKARVFEAALSGCLLFESAGSPLEDWYTPDVDFVSYENVDDIELKLHMVNNNISLYERMAQIFKGKIARNHNQKIFWSQVFAHIGLGEPVDSVAQPRMRPYNMNDGLQAEAGNDQPKLVCSESNLNFVAFGRDVFVVPQSLGPVDLTRMDHQKLPGIKRFCSITEARAEALL